MCNVSVKIYVCMYLFFSPDHLRTGAELSMPVRAPTHGLLTNDSEERLALERSTGFSGNTSLCIHKKYQLRVDKDLGNHYSKKLKYRGIRLMPLISEVCNFGFWHVI